MSITRYQTRARVSRSGLATQNGAPATLNFVTNNIGSQIPQESAHEAASTNPLADTSEKPPRTYSEVAASRPSSPVFTSEEGTLRRPPPKVQVQNTTTKERIPATAGVAFRNNDVVSDRESDLSEPSEPSDKDDNPNPWIKVVPRRSRSLDSLSNTRMNKDFISSKNKALRTEKETVINQAEEQLTTAQKKQISRRYEKIQEKPLNRAESPASQGEGPSHPKGKNVDPWNWGAAQLSDEDLDVDAQRAALESFKVHHKEPLSRLNSENEMPVQKQKTYKRKKKSSKASGNNKTQTPMSDLTGRHVSKVNDRRSARLEKIARNAESRPVNQIAPESYLGRALDNVDKRSHRRRMDSDPDSSDSPDSSSESSSSESSSDDEISDSSQDSPRAKKRAKRKTRHKHKHPKSRSRKSGLKPIPPKEYDGAADARSYHRFVTEGTEYVTTGKVCKNKQVFVLSYYLKGKAYDYYTQKVSMNYRDWTLREFFEQMFNYCFPVNYRMAQRQKLKKCFQNDKTVSEYVYELEELFNMIGIVDDREKVIKLWNGLRSSIQRALWHDGYNPKISEWDDVQNGAENIEISESVPDQQRKGNNLGTHNGHHNNGNSLGKKNARNMNPGSSGYFQKKNPQAPSGQRNNNFQRGSNRSQSQQPRKNFHQNNQSRKADWKNSRPNNFQCENSTAKLSDKEKSKLLASGSCFRCKKPGNMS